MFTDDGLLRNIAVGDEHSDPALMKFLGAELKQETGQFFKVAERKSNQDQERKWQKVKFPQVWETALLPRQVLDKLEMKGFKVGSINFAQFTIYYIYCIRNSNWFAFPIFVFLLYFCSQQK